MAKTKNAGPTKEETLIEKVGHKIGEITDAVAEKYNDIVHPGEKKQLKKAHPRPTAKKADNKKMPEKKATDPKAAKKAAVKKALTEATQKTAARKTANKK